jgi:hypothetical protein
MGCNDTILNISQSTVSQHSHYILPSPSDSSPSSAYAWTSRRDSLLTQTSQSSWTRPKLQYTSKQASKLVMITSQRNMAMVPSCQLQPRQLFLFLITRSYSHPVLQRSQLLLYRLLCRLLPGKTPSYRCPLGVYPQARAQDLRSALSMPQLLQI